MRYRRMYPMLVCFALGLFAIGFVMDDPKNILPGLYTIVSMPDVLITDYVEIAGIGGAFVNAGLVTLVSILILFLSRDPVNGFTLVEIGLMSGFSLFGKNMFNIWPIILGTLLYAWFKREPYSKYISVALLSTALAPIISFLILDSRQTHPVGGFLIGMGIGFVLPPLSAYTYKIQNGMNLYNMGFACGLLAMMMVPIMTAMGDAPEKAAYWSTGNNVPFALALTIFFSVLILGGLFLSGKPAWAVWAGYRRLLQTSGRAPSDYLRMFGGGPVLVNMGVNGFLATLFILITGGDLNGPTIGGIFTILGFSAYGKHARNIVPVMSGVLLGSVVMQWSIQDYSVQIACMFCTTLAPISGYFGWPFGVLAGFLHSAVVLQAGSVLEGVNLYNNGFSGGLIAIVLYPTIMAIAKHRKPVLQEEDYFDVFEGDKPILVTHQHYTEEEVPDQPGEAEE